MEREQKKETQARTSIKNTVRMGQRNSKDKKMDPKRKKKGSRQTRPPTLSQIRFQMRALSPTSQTLFTEDGAYGSSSGLRISRESA